VGVQTLHFPEQQLDFHIFAGPVTAEDMLRHHRTLDITARWLCYFGPTVDFSGVDLAHMPELRSAISAQEKLRAQTLPTVVVAPSEATNQFFRFWRDYASSLVEGRHEPLVVPDLGEACRRLDISPAFQAALASEIGSAETVAPGAR
jgi:hypothetical protein